MLALTLLAAPVDATAVSGVTASQLEGSSGLIESASTRQLTDTAPVGPAPVTGDPAPRPDETGDEDQDPAAEERPRDPEMLPAPDADADSESLPDDESLPGGETVPEPETEQQPQPAPPAEESAEHTPPRAVQNFCSAGKYYALDFRRGNDAAVPLRVAIHEASYDPATSQVSNSTKLTPDFPVDHIGAQSKDMGVNSLGMTGDGVFYFTTQRHTGLVSRPYDIYRYELNSADVTKGGTLTKVVSRGANPSNEAFVAGAVDPKTGDFFFGHYVNSKGNSGRSELHLYRHAVGSNSAGKIGVFRTPAGMNIGDTWGNGDFAFNADGDLIFITSSTNRGNTGALTATVSAEQIVGAVSAGGVRTYDIPRGAVRTGLPMDGGSAFNGIAYTEQGRLIVEQSNDHRIKSTLSFGNLTPSATTISSARALVDLASCFSPPTLEITKNVADRVNPNDQFELVAEWHRGENDKPQPLASTTTSGNATGVQAQKVGPTPVESQTWYTITERGAQGTNLSKYQTDLVCSLPSGNVPTKRISAQSFRVLYPLVDSAQGAALKCQLTNAPLRPALEVKKQADPASGTSVSAGQLVTYTVALDNTSGSAPAPVAQTDHLGDVLDDAIWQRGVTVDGAGVTAKTVDLDDRTGTLTGKNPRLELSGSVPAGKKILVTYTVRVKPDSEVREPGAGRAQYLLRNQVTKTGDTPPPSCAAGSGLCTEHPVPAWSVSKSSAPATGERVTHGDRIDYTLTVKRLGHDSDLTGIVVTDDLTDVMRSASWIESAPEGSGNTPAGEITKQMPRPVFDEKAGTWTATSPAFTLPKGRNVATLTFSVRAGTPERADGWNPHPDTGGGIPHGTSITNLVTATGTVQPAACQTGVPDSFDPASCSVRHTFADFSFDVRKVGDEMHAGTTEPIDLVGHEFQLRADDNGTMSDRAPENACADPTSPDSDPADTPGCWRFIQAESGPEQGEYRSTGLPAGTYWILETRAPTHQRIAEGDLRPIDGIQLLAEPVKFRVTDTNQAYALDVLIPSNAGDVVAEQCDVGSTPQGATACIEPGGTVLRILDPRLVTLPKTGDTRHCGSALGRLDSSALWSSRRTC